MTEPQRNTRQAIRMARARFTGMPEPVEFPIVMPFVQATRPEQAAVTPHGPHSPGRTEER